MREFKHPNMDSFKDEPCPICGTSKDAPVVLVPIPGTEDGNVMKAMQAHAKCWAVWAEMNDIEDNL